MQVIESDVERRVEIYNAVVDLQAAQIDIATVFSEMQRRFGVSREEFDDAVKMFNRIFGLIAAQADGDATITDEEINAIFATYVQGETQREH